MRGQELMGKLNNRIRNWWHVERARQELMCTWPSVSVSQFLTRKLMHAHQFCSIFQMFILYTLSMCARTWCVHWAYAFRNWCMHCAFEQGTCAYTEHMRQDIKRALRAVPSNHAEHTHQEEMRTLSIWVRNWCVPWAIASVPYAYAQHQHKNSQFENVPFWNILSMRARNWCVHWACASGTDECTERTHQELMRTLSIRIRN